MFNETNPAIFDAISGASAPLPSHSMPFPTQFTAPEPRQSQLPAANAINRVKSHTQIEKRVTKGEPKHGLNGFAQRENTEKTSLKWVRWVKNRNCHGCRHANSQVTIGDNQGSWVPVDQNKCQPTKQRDQWTIKSATLSADQKTVFLEIPEIQKANCVHISYNLNAADGSQVMGEIGNTIHELAEN